MLRFDEIWQTNQGENRTGEAWQNDKATKDASVYEKDLLIGENIQEKRILPNHCPMNGNLIIPRNVIINESVQLQ